MMLKQFLLGSVVTVSTLLTISCTSTQEAVVPVHPSSVELLQSRTWVLTHLGANEIEQTALQNTPHLQFNADLALSGSDGCNQIIGAYTLHKDQMGLNQVATTRMLCQNNIKLSADYIAALNKVTHYQVYNQTLRLLDQHGNVLLQFANLKQPR